MEPERVPGALPRADLFEPVGLTDGAARRQLPPGEEVNSGATELRNETKIVSYTM